MACPRAVDAQGGGLSKDNIYQVSSRESRLVSADRVTSSGEGWTPLGWRLSLTALGGFISHLKGPSESQLQDCKHDNKTCSPAGE